MKRVLILPLLFFISSSTTAQRLTKNQAEYFILGTISDSDGRYVNPNSKNEFDYYFQWEKPLVSMIDSIVKVNYPNISFQLKQNEYIEAFAQYCSIYSYSLCHKFEKYYKFKPTGTFTYPEGDAEYYGLLKDSIFKTDDEKLAFLAGAYARFGVTTDTAYCIHISESVSKVKRCYNLLKEFKCEATYKRINNIPTQILVYFHPTAKVETYLQKFMYLNKRIQDERHQIVQGVFDKYSKKDTLKKNK